MVPAVNGRLRQLGIQSNRTDSLLSVCLPEKESILVARIAGRDQC